MARIVWPETILDVLSEISRKERDLILEKVDRLERFPNLYPIRGKGRFRRFRWFFAGNWLVFYRVIEDTVYIRALWPARVP
ncbi:MAG: type II toxin-antitoxin system RelE/ParE family toxin [Terriglobia bacterium]